MDKGEKVPPETAREERRQGSAGRHKREATGDLKMRVPSQMGEIREIDLTDGPCFHEEGHFSRLILAYYAYNS